jgi:hypothetical protein
MKALNITLFALATLAGGVAAADPIQIAVPRDAVPATSTLTRAEVIADFHVWRLAGMQEFSRQELQGYEDIRYREAQARYIALKNSPQYAALVDQIRAKPFAPVVGR